MNMMYDWKRNKENLDEKENIWKSKREKDLDEEERNFGRGRTSVSCKNKIVNSNEG